MNQKVPTKGIRPVFPFTAIIGQDEMKLSLILNVIDPRIGGVMIMGDRGTGKSTTIRAAADLLPEIEVVSFHNPYVREWKHEMDQQPLLYMLFFVFVYHTLRGFETWIRRASRFLNFRLQ